MLTPCKNRRLTSTTSRIRSHAAFAPIDLEICVRGHVANLINRADFFENRFDCFGATGPRKMAFPIENVHRPYNGVTPRDALYAVAIPHITDFYIPCLTDLFSVCTFFLSVADVF